MLIEKARYVLLFILVPILLAGCGKAVKNAPAATKSVQTAPAQSIHSEQPSPPGPTNSSGKAYFSPKAIAFWNAKQGLAVGQVCYPQGGCSGRGEIETTGDGGLTWQVRYQYGSPITFATVTGNVYGWATAGSVLFFTADSGQKWSIIHHNVSIFDPSFVTVGLGWALSPAPSGSVGFTNASDLVYETTDGGTTWRPISRPCPTQGQWSFGETGPFFATAERGWLACLGQPATNEAAKEVLETVDGGRSWQPVAWVPINGEKPSGGLSIIGMPTGLFFLPDGNGWLWEVRGRDWTTTDSGLTWRPVPDGSSDACGNALSTDFISDQTGFVLQHSCDGWPKFNKDLIVTSNGGRTWSIVRTWPASNVH